MHKICRTLTIIAKIAGLQLLVLQPGVKQQEIEPPSMKALITDPYIIMAAGRITIIFQIWNVKMRIFNYLQTPRLWVGQVVLKSLKGIP